MAEKINLRSPRAQEKQRRVQNYGTQTPLSSTAVERGSTRWLEGSNVVIEGLLDVTGTANLSGTNNLDGTNNLSGDNNLTGPTTVAGNFGIIDGGLFTAGDSVIRPDGSAQFGGLDISPDGTLAAGSFELNPDGSAMFGGLEVAIDGTLTSGLFELNPDGSAKFGLFDIDANGNLVSKGSLSIEGVTTLKDDLTVTAGGSIKAGSVEILPDGGGQIAMANGAITSDGFGMGIVNTVGVQISSPNTRLTDLPTTSVAVANLHIDSSGKLWRVV